MEDNEPEMNNEDEHEYDDDKHDDDNNHYFLRNLVPEITICTLKLGSELLHCTIAVSGEWYISDIVGSLLLEPRDDNLFCIPSREEWNESF